MALFNNDYDRDYGYYRGTAGRYGTGMNRPGRTLGNDRYTGYRGTNAGYDTGYMSTNRYDVGYRGAAGYDAGYKSRWETDYGDPFGDRSSNTPIRVINDEYRGHAGYDREMMGRGYDRGMMGGGYDRGMMGGGFTRSDYDRGFTGGGYNRDTFGNRNYGTTGTGYSSNPVGYDPYYGGNRSGNFGRSGYTRGYRGYDEGLF